MPKTKKNTGKGTTSKSNFVSEEAKVRFEQGEKKTFCAERGFEFSGTEPVGYPDHIRQVIEMHQWFSFAQHPEEAAPRLVREFYANFDSEKPDSVRVRGKTIKFSSKVINDFYSLRDDADEYIPLTTSANPNLLDNILPWIAELGTKWLVSKTSIHTVSRLSLTPPAKVWYNFLKVRILPSSHGQTVSKDRALLLFCILSGKYINIGEAIMGSIISNVQKQKGQFLFPSLITGLCKAAGVQLAENEERLATIGPITRQAVRRIETGKEPMEESAQDEGMNREEPTQEQGMGNKNQTTGGVFTEIYQEQIMEGLMSLQNTLLEQTEMLKSLQKGQRKLKNKVTKIKQKNRTYYQYAKMQDEGVARSFAMLSNRSTLPFPRFPTVLLHDSDSDEHSDN